MKELVDELNGVELCHGKLKVWIEDTKDGEDGKLVAIKQPLIAPKNRAVLKPSNDQEIAALLAADVIATIKSQPRGGDPKPAVIAFLCRVYPTPLIHQALSTAKADY